MTNHVVQFPFPAEQIAEWVKILKDSRPEVTTETLKLVIMKFLDGRSKWNHKESLPNIFRGLELLKIEKGEYYDEEKGMKYRNYGEHPARRIYENEKEF